MSEEPPPGSPEDPQGEPPTVPTGQHPSSNPQGPKPFWRRPPFLMVVPPLIFVTIIVIAVLATSHPSSPVASSSPSAEASQAIGQPSSSLSGSPSASASVSGSPSASPAPTMTRQTDVVVFRVSGSGYPSIQYGTDSNNNSPPGGYGPLGNGNALPWSGSVTYDSSALYYYVSAQLQGYGDISDSVTEVITTYCSDGSHKTESFSLASGHASGGYNIALAEYAGGDTGNAQQAESDAGC
jgi:hypothetical protein